MSKESAATNFEFQSASDIAIDGQIEMKVSTSANPTASPTAKTVKNSPSPPVTQERRKKQRFQLRSRVTMVWGQSVYRTFTLDVSLDGLRLADPVPKELVGKVVDCYLFKSDVNSGLRFRGVLVGVPTERVRLRFVEQEVKNQAALQKWISSLKKIG